MNEQIQASKTRAREILTEILDLIGVESTIDVFGEDDGSIFINIDSPDAAILIGKNAQTLDALQYILNRTLYKQDKNAVRCTLDIERYRERHNERILNDAFALANRAVRDRRPFSMSPMSSADRRTVHQALKDRDDIRTVSEPTEIPGIKRVIIEPA